MVLVVSRQVSADDITAARRAAPTSPVAPIGRISLITVGMACSEPISGKRTLAPMPIRTMMKATGMVISAAESADDFATFSSRAQKRREYISGPTTYVAPTNIRSDIRSRYSNFMLVGKEKKSEGREAWNP